MSILYHKSRLTVGVVRSTPKDLRRGILICMQSKRIITFLALFGGFLGGYAPVVLFNASTFSFSSIIGNAIGALLGIYIGFRITRS